MSNQPVTRNFCIRLRRHTRDFDYALVDVFAEQPLEGNAARHLHRRARPLRPTRCRRSPARPISARPPSSSRASPRSSASAASRSASSPSQEELQFAGHPTLGTASWLYLNHPILRGARQITLDLRVGPIPVTLHAATAGRARASSAPCAERSRLRRYSRAAPPSPQRSASRIDDLDPDLPIQTVSTGMPFCIVPLRSLDVACTSRNSAAAGAGLSRAQRRKILPLHHACRRRLRRGLARAHAVLQRRRSRHRLCLGLRHRLSRASRRSPRADSRSSSSRASRCFVPAAFMSRQHCRRRQCHECVRRWSHHSHCNRTLFPAVMHPISTGL